MSQARNSRDRQAATDSALDRSAPGTTDCAAALLVQTTTLVSYPTTAAAFYACNPCTLNGAEIEGGTATPVPDTSTVVAVLNLGTMIPPAGTFVLAHVVGGRLVMRYDG